MANTDFQGLFLLSQQQSFSSLWYTPKNGFTASLKTFSPCTDFPPFHHRRTHPSCVTVALRTVIGWLTYGPKLIGWAWFRVTDAVWRFWVGSSFWPSSESNNLNLSRWTTRYRPDQEGSSPSASSGRPVHQDHRTSFRHHQRSFSFWFEYIFTLFKSMHLFIQKMTWTHLLLSECFSKLKIFLVILCG